MKALVTGANGFIGSHVCAELLARGISVRAATRKKSDAGRLSRLAPHVESVEIDLLTATTADLLRIADGIDVAVLAAWSVVPGEYLTSSDNIRYREATLQLAEALVRTGCAGIAGVGTCFEYQLGSAPLREDSPIAPATPYAVAKHATGIAGEALTAHTRTRFAWARLFYLYGPEEDRRRLVPDITLKLLRGQRAAATAGTQLRDFLHVADVASALVEIVLRGVSGPVNVASGVPISIRTLIQVLAEATGRADLVDFGARPPNLVDPPVVCADNRRLLELTGWRPRFDHTAGLKQTVEWWKAHA